MATVLVERFKNGEDSRGLRLERRKEQTMTQTHLEIGTTLAAQLVRDTACGGPARFTADYFKRDISLKVGPKVKLRRKLFGAWEGVVTGLKNNGDGFVRVTVSNISIDYTAPPQWLL